MKNLNKRMYPWDTYQLLWPKKFVCPVVLRPAFVCPTLITQKLYLRLMVSNTFIFMQLTLSSVIYIKYLVFMYSTVQIKRKQLSGICSSNAT